MLICIYIYVDVAVYAAADLDADVYVAVDVDEMNLYTIRPSSRDDAEVRQDVVQIWMWLKLYRRCRCR